MVMEASTIVFTQWLYFLSETFKRPAHHSMIGLSCSFIMILGHVEQNYSVRLKLAHRFGSALPPTLCMAGVKCRYRVSTVVTYMSYKHVRGLLCIQEGV